MSKREPQAPVRRFLDLNLRSEDLPGPRADGVTSRSRAEVRFMENLPRHVCRDTRAHLP